MRDANHYEIGTFPPARSPKAVQSASQPLIIDCPSKMMIFRAGTMMIGSLIGWIRLIRLSENRKPKKTEKSRNGGRKTFVRAACVPNEPKRQCRCLHRGRQARGS